LKHRGRNPTGMELLGLDGICQVRITQHAAIRFIDRIAPKVCRRLLKAGLNGASNGVSGDVFEAMINGLSRARYVGPSTYAPGWLFADGGVLYVLTRIDHLWMDDPEARFLVKTCLRAHRGGRRSNNGNGLKDLDVGHHQRRQWRAHRLQVLERAAEQELREAG
jgi:hypothetical protein